MLAVVTNNVILVNVVGYSSKKYVVTSQFVTSLEGETIRASVLLLDAATFLVEL